MLRLILVRHGETIWNQEHRVQGGGSDIELSERGKEQAEQLARALRGEKVDAIYSSSLKRALSTAKNIASYHRLQVVPVPDLRELQTGDLEGMSLDKMRHSLFRYVVERDDGGGFPRLPGGESLTDLDERVSLALARILERHPEGIVLMVSHYFVLLTIICHLMSMPIGSLRRLRVETGGISILHIESGQTCLMSFNLVAV